jgi:hypothetical protein
MRLSGFIATLALGLCGACGDASLSDLNRDALETTEIVQDGGISPFVGRLSFKSAEAMAIQEVPYASGKEEALKRALVRYRHQWTFLFVIGLKNNIKLNLDDPIRYDIENNGGMWGNRARNIQRLMFEMKDFIRLKMPSGEEVEPSLVEFERSFGVGQERSFLIVFPRMSGPKNFRPPFEVVVKEFGQGTGTFHFPIKREPSELAWWKIRRAWKYSSISNS